MLKLIIFSDDLTGASGAASMIKNCITLPYYNINKLDLNKFEYISIDLETRFEDNNTIKNRINNILKKIKDVKIALRIDSEFRMNINYYFNALNEYNFILTDTIPEYNRYTINNKTFYKNKTIDIDKILKSKNVKIMDSLNKNDLNIIAGECIKSNYYPADPGILISLYSEKL